MNHLLVHYPGGQYPVCVGSGSLSSLGDLMREEGLSGRVAVVTNRTVERLFGDRVNESLRRAGFSPILCAIADGEQNKTLETAAGVYDALIEAGLDRGSTIVALGGGVVGDLAGFVAATYLRGIPFVQAPTTILAMIDSSLGGKVAVDHRRGKNLIGAFHQPRLVVTDSDALQTLPAGELRSGLAEVIKHGIISAPELFERIEAQGPRPLEWIIERAIRVKVEVIEEDPFEHGRRAILNLGHTYGHAFEAVSSFSLRHGEAVAIGLVGAARTAVSIGVCAPEVEARITALLVRQGLPVACPGHAVDSVRQAMNADKKRRDGRLRFVLPTEIGSVEMRSDVPEEIVLRVIESLVS